MISTCGYVCPQCGGKGYDDDGNTCYWCSDSNLPSHEELSKEEWIEKVHGACACSDITGIEKSG